MRKLVIYGLSNPVLVKLIDSINRDGKIFDLLGFVKGPGNRPLDEIMGYPVLGSEECIPELAKQDDVCFFCNINYTPAKMREADVLLEEHGCEIISLIHPDIDMKDVKHGKNVMLCEGTMVGPNVVIGDHLTCRLGVIISHDVVIGDCVYLSPGVTVCGESVLKDGADLGTRATILPRLTIGRNAIIGAGAVVTKDVPPNVTAVGVPAKIIKHHDAES